MTKSRRGAGRLDEADLRILEIIQNNGRISKKALASSVGLSLTPCFQRLRRLEQQGFIHGYRGMVHAERLGSFVWVHTEVTLARHLAADFSRFEAAVLEMPEVLECDAVGGGIDYLLKIVARDVSHYQRMIEGLLNSNVGVETYFTYIVTKRIKESTAIPLSSLLSTAEGD